MTDSHIYLHLLSMAGMVTSDGIMLQEILKEVIQRFLASAVAGEFCRSFIDLHCILMYCLGSDTLFLTLHSNLR